jgi:hypothetical protein
MALGARGKRAADLAAVSAARAMADAYPRLFEPPAYLTARHLSGGGEGVRGPQHHRGDHRH